MAAGHDEEVDILMAEKVVMDHDKVLSEEGPVAFHDPFRFPGGAACVHDNPGILGIHLCGRFLRTCCGHCILIGNETVIAGAIKAEGDIFFNGGKIFLHPVDHIDPGKCLPVLLIHTALNDKDLALTVVDVVFHLRG